MKKDIFKFFDEEERELIESYENGHVKPYPKKKEEALKKKMKEAAANYRKKNARINIRLSSSDLTMLRMQAANQGLPYQTLVSSIIHQYVAGHLKSTL